MTFDLDDLSRSFKVTKVKSLIAGKPMPAPMVPIDKNVPYVLVCEVHLDL